jgi:ADP-ribosylation factor family
LHGDGDVLVKGWWPIFLHAGFFQTIGLELVICEFTSLQDLPGALSDAEVAEGLGLPQIKNRDWAIFKTSAVKGDGLFEGAPFFGPFT